jgi:hypothetical protein
MVGYLAETKLEHGPARKLLVVARCQAITYPIGKYSLCGVIGGQREKQKVNGQGD